MPLIARQRSRLAVLAVLALVGSLLAVSAVPAVAAGDGKVSNAAKFSACVGGATADAGFEDITWEDATTAANCLAYYGITKGTSEGMFSPGATVTRLQMALFLQRAAGPAGATLAAATDQKFTDIGGLTDEIQNAINQVAAAGIMSGSGTSFNPSGLVNRQDMAAHLSGLLKAALRGPGGTDIEATTAAKNGIVDANRDTGVFSDISNVPNVGWNAIINLYEMGVTKGATDTTFNPLGLVTRGQMAVFITRALAHTNARPMGISAQVESTEVFKASSVTFVTSVRDDSFMPVSGALVDTFHAEGDDARTKAFKDDGTCIANPPGGADCTITLADMATDANGNIETGVARTVTASAETVWLWTGDSGDTFDNDTTDSVSFDLTGNEDAANVLVSSNAPENAKTGGRDTSPHAHDDGDYTQIKYGEELEITLQMIDANGDPVAKKDQTVTVQVQISTDASDDGTATSTSDNTMTHKTDESGTIALSFTENDPNPGTGNDDATRIVVTFSAPAVGTVQDSAGNAVTALNFEWNDDAAQATQITLKFPRAYTTASDVGSGASASVQAVLSDQYGDPLGSKKIAFTSDQTDGVGSTARNRYTGGNGMATLGYNRDATTGATEAITATFVDDRGTTDTDDDITITSAATGNVFYWTTEAPTDSDTSGPLVAVDTDNNTIVVGTVQGTYDSNDYFYVGSDTSIANAKSMADFEKGLVVGRNAQFRPGANAAAVGLFRVAAS